MILLLSLLFLLPLIVFGIALIAEDLREDIVAIYSGEVLKRKKKKELRTIELEFPSVVELFAIRKED